MVQSADHFEKFEPHTLLKHAILRLYIERWARKLLLRPNAGTSLRIVDACAGRGSDDAGNPGSPLLAALEAAKARTQVSELRQVPVQIEVVAIEKKALYFRDLKQKLLPFGESVRALRGTLEDYIEEFAADFNHTPTLFFIDPFGLSPLKANAVGRALSGPKNEALMLFADQAALRHFGAYAARASDPSEQVSLDFGEVEVTQQEESGVERASALEITAEAAEEILDAAFGEVDWRSRIRKTPQSGRRQEFLTMYEELLHRLGGKFVLPIPVVDTRKSLTYHLMYASKSVHGLITMKTEIERAWNAAPVTGTSLDMMRFMVSCGIEQIERMVRQHFAGKIVPWKSEDSKEEIKSYALGYTPAFPSQLSALQERLKALKLPGRKLVYEFPPR